MYHTIPTRRRSVKPSKGFVTLVEMELPTVQMEKMYSVAESVEGGGNKNETTGNEEEIVEVG